MAYSDDDVRNFYLDIDRITGRDNTVTSLEELKKRLRKEVNFQDECEGGNSLGNLLLKHATENNNPRVKDFLLQNGCEPLQQEQITAAINKEEEAPNVEENRADSNEVDSSNFINPGMTAEVLYEQLIQGKETNLAIFDSFANAVRESNITGDRGIFLDVVKLFTDLDAVIHLTDTASRTILGIATITKQADVVKVLLDSGKFYEEEKFNALCLAITQDNAQEAELILGYVSPANRKEALQVAIQVGKTEIVNAFLNRGKLNEENRAEPSSSNGNIGSRPVATVPPVSTNGDNRNHDNEIPVVTETNQTTTPNSDNVNGQSNHNNKNKTPVIPEAKQTATPNNDNKANGFVDAQFSVPNEKEAKYKKSKENFYTSLTKDVVGVVITGLFITAAVMVPFVTGAVICGVIAALVAIATGLHVKNSTLPSYREMRENEVERVTGCHPSAQTLGSRRS
ncbi:ankyrin repeat domain-containing protein [Wolbachia endosymbiont of Rhagoletis cerasi]|uniref:ankyrin repeat domain-containing protein n=1 Tax=Wolbachia endosymbiont of Rhagoletis cerasi TaxID=225363 RepID=UPI001BD63459|nr:ankyrin repeat domain-containing protein [Wolbachia endosymbiont of Rhagoletis cerasi]MBS9530280.1 ankyrin repeat domain-containing protein [Wolbachia endosymbiont of Rhagoletis cerasi]